MANVTIAVDLVVPQEVIDAGGIELFAKAYGWTEKVLENDVEIDNPVSALDKGREVVRGFVREVVKAEMIKQAKINAADQTSEAFDKMFSE